MDNKELSELLAADIERLILKNNLSVAEIIEIGLNTYLKVESGGLPKYESIEDAEIDLIRRGCNL